jgi:signal transduction histidine kinase
MDGDMGAIEASKGNTDSAIKYFIAALKIHTSIKDYKGIMVVCTNLGSLYLQHDDSANASKYYFMAEAASKQSPVIDQTIYLYNAIAVYYAAIGKNDKALEYFLNNLKLSDKPQFVNSHLECLSYIGDYYVSAGDHAKALQYLQDGLRLARENHIQEIESNILVSMAEINKTSDPATALDYLNKAEAIAKETQNRSFLVSVLRNKVTLLKQMGKIGEALAVLEEKQKLSDSVYTLNKSRELVNITAAYQLETNERIQELEGLSRKNAMQRDIIIVVAAVLAILIFVLLFNYRKIKKLSRRSALHEKQLEQLNGMKDKLFSVIGHDLRGPIARIATILEMYEDPTTSPDERKMLMEGLKDQTKASVETFDKLLYWGKSLVKGVSVQQQKIHPKSFIRDSIELRKIKAAEKNIIIKDNTPNDAHVWSDPSIFDFVMRNLLANALKYTPRNGSIIINLDTTIRPGYSVFVVKDSGVGIDKATLPNIFYSLKSKPGTENEEGHGIGLMLCKEFAVLNMGDIWVESELGHGATFYFAVQTESGM